VCNYCHQNLRDGEILICSHGYHFQCYQKIEFSCYSCEEYYKCEIYNNVKFLVNRLEKRLNVLTAEEKEDINNGVEAQEEDQDYSTTEEIELDRIQKVYMALLNEINHVSTW
ncbi:16078_t:CDS:1, partial [Dentiscutata heterogama]